MVITGRQFTVLPVEAMTAEIVVPRRTYAVPAPVPQGTHDAVQQRMIGVNRAALTHRHMMGRVKARSAYVSESPRKPGFSVQRIQAAERITVVLNEPQAVSLTERFHGFDVKRIAECMGQHHRFCPPGESSFKERHVHIRAGQFDIHKYRDCAALKDRSHGSRETRGNRNDLIPREHPPVTEQRRSERRKCQQVGTRSRIDQAYMPDPQILRKFPLKPFRIPAGCQPEFQGRIHEVFHFFVSVHPGSVRNTVAFMELRTLHMEPVTIFPDGSKYGTSRFLFTHPFKHQNTP